MIDYPLPLVVGMALMAAGCTLGFIAYSQMHIAHHREKRHRNTSR